MPIIAVGGTSEIATSTPMAESITWPQGLGDNAELGDQGKRRSPTGRHRDERAEHHVSWHRHRSQQDFPGDLSVRKIARHGEPTQTPALP